MATVAVLPHRGKPQARALARDVLTWLAAQGHDGRVPADDAAATGLEEWSSDGELTEGLDLALSIGGDGTMLRTVDLVCRAGVPVLGVNVGHLGYLTVVDPEGLIPALERFFVGDHAVEERMTLDVEAGSADGSESACRTALNEAVLEKTVSGHTVRFAVEIDGDFFATYAADGVIVATPTGSTAYNLSARGPIVSPRLDALLMTPVSPHMLFDRSLLLHPDESVRLVVLDGRPASVVVDGQAIAKLSEGGWLSCRAGAQRAKLVTFGGRDFHQILKSKFSLADR